MPSKRASFFCTIEFFYFFIGKQNEGHYVLCSITTTFAGQFKNQNTYDKQFYYRWIKIPTIQ